MPKRVGRRPTRSCARTRSRCSRGTGTARTPCPRSASTRTSGAGTPARSPSGGPRPGEWDHAWGELEQAHVSAQWPSGMVPHIVFWQPSDDYFPGPDVWATGREPPTTGLTQPPLPVSAAARLFAADPDRDRADATMRHCSGRAWSPGSCGSTARAADRTSRERRRAPVGVRDGQLAGVGRAARRAYPRRRTEHLERRDVASVAASQRPSNKEYRHYLGIVMQLRDAGWDTERQIADSPFAVEDPGFTAIIGRAASISPPSPTRPGRTRAT